jgi:hypothetical protein
MSPSPAHHCERLHVLAFSGGFHLAAAVLLKSMESQPLTESLEGTGPLKTEGEIGRAMDTT